MKIEYLNITWSDGVMSNNYTICRTDLKFYTLSRFSDTAIIIMIE